MKALNTPDRWFLIAVLSGAIIALISVITTIDAPQLETSDWIMKIDGKPIPTSRYQSALEAATLDTQRELTDAEQKDILERLIDNELLLLHALELNLLESNVRVRNTMIGELMEGIFLEAASEIPSEAELEEWYVDNVGFFRYPPLLSLSVATVPVGTCDEIQPGTTPQEAVEQFPDAKTFSGIPAAATPKTVRELLGASLANIVITLEIGEVARHRSAQTCWIVQIEDRVEGEIPDFVDVRDAVLSLWIRDRDERILREYLQTLRDLYDVELAPQLN